MSITQDIKNYALNEIGVDLVGIAPIERFKDSPPGKHPCDILPGAKSVVVFGVKLLDGAIQANFRNFEEGKKNVHGIYGTYGYTIAPNFHLMWANYYIARYIEKVTGKTACPTPAGPMQNGGPLSMRHCALAAGLGEFGWMGIILTPEFGPRNRFGAIITQAELDPDPMYSGPKLCDPTKCHVCVDRCVTGAIAPYSGPEEGRHTIMEGRDYHYSNLDWNRCRLACHGLSTKVGGNQDLITTENPTSADIEAAINQETLSGGGMQTHDTWRCGHCLSYCPVGNWKERFYDTGLSKGKHMYEQYKFKTSVKKQESFGFSYQTERSKDHGDMIKGNEKEKKE